MEIHDFSQAMLSLCTCHLSPNMPSPAELLGRPNQIVYNMLPSKTPILLCIIFITFIFSFNVTAIFVVPTPIPQFFERRGM